MKGKVVEVSISAGKGSKKHAIPCAVFIKGYGIDGDAHAGQTHRQVSLLAKESIDKMKGLKVAPGAFAENITTKDIDLLCLTIGDRIRVGKGVVLEITQIGKECHERCAIYHQMGDCIMPREGIFAKVIEGGEAKKGDSVESEGSSAV